MALSGIEKTGGDPFDDDFFVPDNLYVIGTMNDIDRGVETMDFAFRRRFALKKIKARDHFCMWEDEDNGIRPSIGRKRKDGWKS